MATKVISYKEFAIKAMKSAWNHIKTYHFGQTSEFIEDRVLIGILNERTGLLEKTEKSSCFIGSEKNVRTFIVKTLNKNESYVMKWLKEDHRETLFLKEELPLEFVKGISFDGEWHVCHHGIIVLQKEGCVFRIKTSFPAA